MRIKFNNKVYNINEILQYEDIYYSKLCNCHCEYADYSRNSSYNIVGYCNTNNGYMVVFECKKCFEKYRHHIDTDSRYSFDKFKADLRLILYQREKHSKK